MSTLKVDKDVLKSVVKEVLVENPLILKNVLIEVFSEINRYENEDTRLNKIKEMIEEDFNQYDDVFKALA